MEYEVPRDAGLDALKASIARIRDKQLPVTFPFEFRWVAADDIWLSPFHAGPCASISMHQFAPMPYAPGLRRGGADPAGGGRAPALGQAAHADRARRPRPLSAKPTDFLAVRARVDPTAKFANPFLRTLFGITPRG